VVRLEENAIDLGPNSGASPQTTNVGVMARRQDERPTLTLWTYDRQVVAR